MGALLATAGLGLITLLISGIFYITLAYTFYKSDGPILWKSYKTVLTGTIGVFLVSSICNLFLSDAAKIAVDTALSLYFLAIVAGVVYLGVLMHKKKK